MLLYALNMKMVNKSMNEWSFHDFKNIFTYEYVWQNQAGIQLA